MEVLLPAARGGPGGPCSWCPLPAGAGKTVVGFHIVFWFHKSNEEQVGACAPPSEEKQPGGPCILYCGPSNKSVDVLAGALGWWCGGSAWGCWPRGTVPHAPLPPGLLLSRRTELKPLRVYSEQAEAADFPMPGVGGRRLPKKSPREGSPNPMLRCGLSAVCLWVEAKGPTVLSRTGVNAGLHGCPPAPQEHHPAPQDPAGFQPLRTRHQGA